MEYRKLGSNKILVRIARGEEIMKSLVALCAGEGIRSAWITGIGATGDATVGLYQQAEKGYHKKSFTGDYEITSLIGDVTFKDGALFAHCHVTLADNDLSVHGGHLYSAVVSATFEGMMEVIEEGITRFSDEETGLHLLRLS